MKKARDSTATTTTSTPPPPEEKKVAVVDDAIANGELSRSAMRRANVPKLIAEALGHYNPLLWSFPKASLLLGGSLSESDSRLSMVLYRYQRANTPLEEALDLDSGKQVWSKEEAKHAAEEELHHRAVTFAAIALVFGDVETADAIRFICTGGRDRLRASENWLDNKEAWLFIHLFSPCLFSFWTSLVVLHLVKMHPERSCMLRQVGQRVLDGYRLRHPTPVDDHDADSAEAIQDAIQQAARDELMRLSTDALATFMQALVCPAVP